MKDVYTPRPKKSSVHVRGLKESVVTHFKANCYKRGRTMKDVVEDLMKEFNRKSNKVI